jgi:sugar PTS system EIIA component
MFNFLKKETTLFSPVNGKAIKIEDVPDQIFAKKMMGEGIGFINDENKIYAPCDSEVVLVASTKHAIGLKTKSGIEILIHVGLDTVNLNGEGLEVYVEVKDKVKAGDLLLSYEKDFMNKKGVDMTTPMVITNSNDFDIEVISSNKQVSTKDAVMKIIKKK